MSDPKDNMTEDELIDAAMAAFDQEPLPETTLPEQELSPDEAAARQQEEAEAPPPMSASPTLDALAESRRPKVKTACEDCPNSVWFASPAEVKCYCRVMFLTTWSSKEPNQITHCDGQFLGQE